MIKEQSQTWAKISAQIGVTFSRLPLAPNVYTWLSIIPAILGFFAIVYGYVFSGVLLFILSGILDLIDGAVARQTGKVSKYGAFLDGSLDRIVDFLVIFSYLWLPIEVPAWGLDLGGWLIIAVYFAILPSFEVAYANHRQAVDDPHERIIWRILNRGEMYVLMLLIPVLSIFNSVWAGYILVVLVVLSVITTLQTFFSTLYHARKLGR
jgi:archaetidylinositol phosphate synthase